MREHPERYFSIPIMRAYASSLRKNKGASLSIAQLKQLGHAFKEQTLDTRVGGPEQTAVLTVKGFELEGPTNPPRVKRPQPFLFAACPPGKGLVFSSRMPEPKVPIVFEHCDFTSGGEEISLDGIYLKCSFRNVRLLYLGGDTVFGLDNLVEGNSQPLLGQDACRRPDIANELAKRFDFAHGGSLFPGTDHEVQPYCNGRNPTPRGAEASQNPN